MTDDPKPAEELSPVRFSAGALELLDQTRLPQAEEWIACTSVEGVADAIRRLAVRGAPAIGIAAAYGLVVALLDPDDPEPDAARRFANAVRILGDSRPTAVNLRWALEQGEEAFELLKDRPPVERAAKLLDWARALHADDVDRNRRMAEHGAALFAEGDRVLTHCNAGALATGGIGTAIGVIAAAYRAGRVGAVWVDETRPLLQGARLTAWEMQKLGIPHRLVTDSAAFVFGGLRSRAAIANHGRGCDGRRSTADRVFATDTCARMRVRGVYGLVSPRRHNQPCKHRQKQGTAVGSQKGQIQCIRAPFDRVAGCSHRGRVPHEHRVRAASS